MKGGMAGVAMSYHGANIIEESDHGEIWRQRIINNIGEWQ